MPIYILISSLNIGLDIWRNFVVIDPAFTEILGVTYPRRYEILLTNWYTYGTGIVKCGYGCFMYVIVVEIIVSNGISAP